MELVNPDILKEKWTLDRVNKLCLNEFAKLIFAVCNYLEDKFYKQIVPLKKMSELWDRTILLHNHLTCVNNIINYKSLVVLGLSHYVNSLDDVIIKVQDIQSQLSNLQTPMDKYLNAPNYLWFWNSTEKQYWADIINLMIHANNARLMANTLLPILLQMLEEDFQMQSDHNDAKLFGYNN